MSWRQVSVRKLIDGSRRGRGGGRAWSRRSCRAGLAGAADAPLTPSVAGTMNVLGVDLRLQAGLEVAGPRGELDRVDPQQTARYVDLLVVGPRRSARARVKSDDRLPKSPENANVKGMVEKPAELDCTAPGGGAVPAAGVPAGSVDAPDEPADRDRAEVDAAPSWRPSRAARRSERTSSSAGTALPRRGDRGVAWPGRRLRLAVRRRAWPAPALTSCCFAAACLSRAATSSRLGASRRNQ